MSGPDLAWRGGGAALVAAAVALKSLCPMPAPLAMALFAVALAGVVMVAQGERLPADFRAERGRQRRHRFTRLRRHRARRRRR